MIGTSVGNGLIFKAKPEDGLLLSILLLKINNPNFVMSISCIMLKNVQTNFEHGEIFKVCFANFHYYE